ncbi:MAG: hypothetical protein L6R48_14790 [Planctomycetes bacterium]|nr:hypothetical protein [Planctomycetota bacterium]
MTDHTATDEAMRQHQHIGASAKGGAFARNQHPEAQCSPHAALGLFIRFGISGAAASCPPPGLTAACSRSPSPTRPAIGSGMWST